jgi:hypothetical protein
VRTIGIAMSEMDEPSLVVPDVLAVDDHIVSRRDGYAFADIDVVCHEYGLRRARQADDETLMRTGRPRVVGEKARDIALRGDLNA